MGYRALVRLQLRRAYATLAPRPPAFADISLYHSGSSYGAWVLVQLLHAADESALASHSTEDQFSQPSRVLLDPALVAVVDRGRTFMMHSVFPIADIVSA